MLPSYKKEIFLFLTVFAAFFILYPLIDAQSVMATGDHGRDLYAARAVFHGQAPYKDYWWVYGPLMPYYYALCFLYLGVHVPAILMGKAFLALLSSVFVYLALTTAAVPCALAFIGALWFLAFFPEFGITYNHIGGTALFSGLIYLIFSYFRQPKTIFLYLGLVCVFLISLVKINFGIMAFLGLLTAVVAADFFYKNAITREKVFFYIGAALLPLLVLPFYFILLKDLPAYALRQCFPYFGAYTLHHTPVLVSAAALLDMIKETITGSPVNFWLAVVIIFCAVQTVLRISDKMIQRQRKITLLLMTGILVLFYILNLHEFLASGIFYRVAWSKPFAYLLIFILLAVGTERLRKELQVLLYGTLFIILSFQVLNVHSGLKAIKTPQHYLALDRGKVFLGNDPGWINTVTETTGYLQANLKKDELFFALPYDPLYYYLTDKITPTRQIIFFDHEFIPPQQEQATIEDLEHRQVNWILLSSRHNAKEFGLGTFGQTYCPILAQYIAQNFEVVAEFGDWINEPGWAWHHGTKVLKRISQ